MSYQDTMEASLDKRNRVDLLDLKDQREGEAHVFFKSNIVRMKSFYANPPKVQRLKINQFLKVAPPSQEELKRLKAISLVGELEINLEEKLIEYHENDSLINSLMKRVSVADSLSLDQACQCVIEINEMNEGTGEEEHSEFIPKNDVFLNIALEKRVESIYFDFEVSSLEDCLIDYKKIKIAVEKLAILSDLSKSDVKNISSGIAEKLSAITSYTDDQPTENVSVLIDEIIGNE
ncbi:hypothetical protein [Piscirickettsia litoralis]|uniref:hypothetical protein n=1 Tax=Piscirickettsia litoralis TaxID=1891921 RepID=UPI000A560FC1|nr:hypothetical protein [Piscirickettsia litoralis]